MAAMAAMAAMVDGRHAWMPGYATAMADGQRAGMPGYAAGYAAGYGKNGRDGGRRSGNGGVRKCGDFGGETMADFGVRGLLRHGSDGSDIWRAGAVMAGAWLAGDTRDAVMPIMRTSGERNTKNAADRNLPAALPNRRFFVSPNRLWRIADSRLPIADCR